MAANATNIPGGAAPDAEIKGQHADPQNQARRADREAGDAKSNFQH
jgi:hypothetical protein